MDALDTEIFNLQRKVDQYKEVLQNTVKYREEWKASLREKIRSTLQHLVTATKLEAEIIIRSEIENLEAVVLNLGTAKSLCTKHLCFSAQLLRGVIYLAARDT